MKTIKRYFMFEDPLIGDEDTSQMNRFCLLGVWFLVLSFSVGFWVFVVRLFI